MLQFVKISYITVVHQPSTNWSHNCIIIIFSFICRVCLRIVSIGITLRAVDRIIVLLRICIMLICILGLFRFTCRGGVSIYPKYSLSYRICTLLCYWHQITCPNPQMHTISTPKTYYHTRHPCHPCHPCHP